MPTLFLMASDAQNMRSQRTLHSGEKTSGRSILALLSTPHVMIEMSHIFPLHLAHVLEDALC